MDAIDKDQFKRAKADVRSELDRNAAITRIMDRRVRAGLEPHGYTRAEVEEELKETRECLNP